MKSHHSHDQVVNTKSLPSSSLPEFLHKNTCDIDKLNILCCYQLFIFCIVSLFRKIEDASQCSLVLESMTNYEKPLRGITFLSQEKTRIAERKQKNA